MGAWLRGLMHQSPSAAAAISLVPHREQVVKTILAASTWSSSTSLRNSAPAADSSSSSCPLKQTPGAIVAKNFECGAFAKAVINSIRKYSSSVIPAPVFVGYDTSDSWNSRRDLQPCEAVFHEDVEPTALVIDGKAIAKEIRRNIAEEVGRIRDLVGKVPGLAIVLVGNREDSATHVKTKHKACEEVGFVSFGVTLPEDATEEDVVQSVCKFKSNPAVHAILVQLPLPEHMSEEKVLTAIDVEKDVDGLHPSNVGRLALQGRTPLHVACTPRGCMELLLRSGVTMKGKHAVVVGRDNLVGMPVAILLQRQNATVTIVHSHTPNPAEVTRRADIVVVAVGVPHLVRGDWIKPGAVVLDVGLNSVEDPTAKKGYRLVGDVCYQEASQVASKITPVPGGVGPMTIAMLLLNTLDAAKRSLGLTCTQQN